MTYITYAGIHETRFELNGVPPSKWGKVEDPVERLGRRYDIR